MKTILFAIALALTGTGAYAAQPLTQLSCLPPGGGSGMGVRATLDPNHFTPGSGFADVTSVRITFEFSHVPQMVCDRSVDLNNIDVNCVGYYMQGEETRVNFRHENGKVIANWQTAEVYGKVPMRSECTVSEKIQPDPF